MDVSKNNGTPKSSILIGFSIIFTIHFGGPPLFSETPICSMYGIFMVNVGQYSIQGAYGKEKKHPKRSWLSHGGFALRQVRKCCYMAPVPDDVPTFARCFFSRCRKNIFRWMSSCGLLGGKMWAFSPWCNLGISLKMT